NNKEEAPEEIQEDQETQEEQNIAEGQRGPETRDTSEEYETQEEQNTPENQEASEEYRTREKQEDQEDEESQEEHSEILETLHTILNDEQREIVKSMSIEENEQSSIFKKAIALHQEQEYDKAIKLYEEFLASLNQTEASSTET